MTIFTYLIIKTTNRENIYIVTVVDSKLLTIALFFRVYFKFFYSNHRTIKGVNFFGPNSEYVISGSDCGNIFFWDKNTEAIINFMPGDTMGVVSTHIFWFIGAVGIYM